MTEKPVKHSSSPDAAAIRRGLFAKAYIELGRNATAAAKKVGAPASAAAEQGYVLLNHAETRPLIEAEEKKLQERFDVDLQKIIKEIAKIALLDPREVLDNDGVLLPPDQWPDHAAMAIAGIDVSEIWEGVGPDRTKVGELKKVKFWNKVDTLEKLMKHLGGYKEDNEQLGKAIAKAIVVPAKEGER